MCLTFGSFDKRARVAERLDIRASRGATRPSADELTVSQIALDWDFEKPCGSSPCSATLERTVFACVLVCELAADCFRPIPVPVESRSVDCLVRCRGLGGTVGFRCPEVGLG